MCGLAGIVDFAVAPEARRAAAISGLLIHRGPDDDARTLDDLLPRIVGERTDKIGFATSEAEWLRGPLGTFAAEVFESRELRERGFVDAQAVLARPVPGGREHRWRGDLTPSRAHHRQADIRRAA